MQWKYVVQKKEENMASGGRMRIKTNNAQEAMDQRLHMQWEEAEHNVHEHTQKWNEVVLTTEAIFPFICVFRQGCPQWFHCTWSFRELIPTFFSRQEVNSMKLKQQMPNMRKGEGRHQLFEASHGMRGLWPTLFAVLKTLPRWKMPCPPNFLKLNLNPHHESYLPELSGV